LFSKEIGLRQTKVLVPQKLSTSAASCDKGRAFDGFLAIYQAASKGSLDSEVK
jgi:hypothetical protein